MTFITVYGLFVSIGAGLYDGITRLQVGLERCGDQ